MNSEENVYALSTHAPPRSRRMQRFASPSGAIVSYDKAGQGPPLVLVHGAFSDHVTNWEYVSAALRKRFMVIAVARRGRGDTDATVGHSVEDEVRDVVAAIQSVGEPVFLLGHSYGAHCALAAALLVPHRVRKLVLYEAPSPRMFSKEALAELEKLAAVDAWSDFAFTFFRDTLAVPLAELEALRDSTLWAPIVADARASLGDLRAISRYRFEAEPCRALDIPVMLQIGSESPRDLYVTDALAAALPNGRIEVLADQAHEGMTTAPDAYVESVLGFLCD